MEFLCSIFKYWVHLTIYSRCTCTFISLRTMVYVCVHLVDIINKLVRINYYEINKIINIYKLLSFHIRGKSTMYYIPKTYFRSDKYLILVFIFCCIRTLHLFFIPTYFKYPIKLIENFIYNTLLFSNKRVI